MRRFSIFFSMIVVLLITGGCSNEVKLSLVEHHASIIGVENEIFLGKKSVLAVYAVYRFTIKNDGVKLGAKNEPNAETFIYDDGIHFEIQPSEALEKLSEDNFGENIFVENNGMGHGSTPIIKRGETIEDIELTYFLGTIEDTEGFAQVPSKEQLAAFERQMNNAKLVGTVNGERVATFNLNE